LNQSVAVFTIKRVDAVLELTRAYLPMRVASDGDFEDWQVIAPALVSIVGDLFEGIASSTPPRGRVRAEVLARSLAEYAIGFAWLAGSGEDRPARIKSVLRDEFGERKKAANKLEKEIAGRRGYKDLFDPEKREGTLPTTLLDQATEERLASLEADTSIKPLPNAMDMAFAADQVWMPQIDMVARNPFALVYFTLFTGPSFSTHPSISAVAKMTAGPPQNLAVGAAEALGGSESPYGQSYLALINTLLVASKTLGWPDEGAIQAALFRD
jgi:hypothetical protein